MSFEMLRRDLESSREQLETLLPPGYGVGRFIVLVVSACKRTPALAGCDRFSLLNAIKEAAELGLEPNGPLGHGWILPYGKEAKFIPGYRGFIQLAIEEGGYQIWAKAVYRDEPFEVEEGTAPRIVHRPRYDIPRENEDLILVYAVAQPMAGGIPQFAIMSRKEVERIQHRSKSAKAPNSPWTTDFAEMAKKCPVRQLMKFLSLKGGRMSKLLAVDNADYDLRNNAQAKPVKARVVRPQDAPPMYGNGFEEEAKRPHEDEKMVE